MWALHHRFNEEYKQLSPDLREKFDRHADRMNRQHQIDLRGLPPLPPSYVPTKPVTGRQIYGMRKLGVGAAPIDRLRLSGEYELLNKESMAALDREAEELNSRIGYSTFSAPPLPPDFTIKGFIDGVDVYGLRKYGRDLRGPYSVDGLNAQREYQLLTPEDRDALDEEAREIMRRSESSAPLSTLAPFPANFNYDRRLDGWDVYAIQRVGEAAWRRDAYAASRGYYSLSRDARRGFEERARQINSQHQISKESILSRFSVRGEGQVERKQPAQSHDSHSHSDRR